MPEIIVTTIVSNRTGQGRIDIEMPPQATRAQLSVEEARALGVQLIEAAEAAQFDAMLVQFVQEKLGVEQNTAAQILCEFREMRGKIA